MTGPDDTPPADTPPAEPPPAGPPKRPPVRRRRLSEHEQRWAPLAHLLAVPAMLLGLGFLGPALVGRYRSGASPFVRHHVVQAVNFNVTVALAGTVALLVMAFGADNNSPASGAVPAPQWVPATALMALLVVLVYWFLFLVRAAMGAREGEWYRYPPSLPVLRFP